jgi:hypothetical protein
MIIWGHFLSSETKWHPNSRSPINPNWDEVKEDSTETHYNQIVKIKNKENFKTVQENLQETISWFVSRNFRTRRHWENVLQSCKEKKIPMSSQEKKSPAKQEYHIWQNCPSKMEECQAWWHALVIPALLR